MNFRQFANHYLKSYNIKENENVNKNLNMRKINHKTAPSRPHTKIQTIPAKNASRATPKQTYKPITKPTRSNSMRLNNPKHKSMIDSLSRHTHHHHNHHHHRHEHHELYNKQQEICLNS
jgi:hypothetical protein